MNWQAVLQSLVLCLGIAIIASVAIPFIVLRSSKAWYFGRRIASEQYRKHVSERED